MAITVQDKADVKVKKCLDKGLFHNDKRINCSKKLAILNPYKPNKKLENAQTI